MIKTMAIAVLILLYLRIGVWIFQTAVEDMGGKEVYILEIRRKNNLKARSARIAYGIAFCILSVFWPWFLIEGFVMSRRR